VKVLEISVGKTNSTKKYKFLKSLKNTLFQIVIYKSLKLLSDKDLQFQQFFIKILGSSLAHKGRGFSH
jgi:hypothetical protein